MSPVTLLGLNLPPVSIQSANFPEVRDRQLNNTLLHGLSSRYCGRSWQQLLVRTTRCRIHSHFLENTKKSFSSSSAWHSWSFLRSGVLSANRCRYKGPLGKMRRLSNLNPVQHHPVLRRFANLTWTRCGTLGSFCDSSCELSMPRPPRGARAPGSTWEFRTVSTSDRCCKP